MEQSKLSFILGGARSGKSRYVEEYARQKGKNVLFIATATAGDDEMRLRIQNHQASRPKNWQTLEAPRDIPARLAEVLQKETGGQADTIRPDIVILDCITMLTSNILCTFPEELDFEVFEKEVEKQTSELLAAIRQTTAHWLVISNEIGLGIVPANAYSRSYRDALGRANQKIAAEADEVLFMVAGIPMKVK